jgi:peptide-methionine (S)-S-oxide reductase
MSLKGRPEGEYLRSQHAGSPVSALPSLPPATETAILGGGCFWCLEAVYAEIEGVHSVRPGYAGGTLPNPRYEDVCGGRTGHAEVVEIVFDPAILPFRDVLTVFFALHDPTTLNRQGNDVGTQYRSVIFCQSQTQRAQAQAVLEEIAREGAWSAPLVTEIAAAPEFFPAEDEHHTYFERNPAAPYCAYVVAPKVSKLRRQFRERLKRKPPPA